MTQLPLEPDQDRSEVKQRYGFADWPGRAGRAAAGLYLPDHALLAGLPFDRRVPFSGTGRAFIDLLAGPDGARVALWIQHYDTILDAHEGLVDVLATSMAPRLPDGADRGLGEIGDVAFGGMTEPVTAVFFVRGNVLVRAESIGERPIAIAAVAAEIDRQIRAQIETGPIEG